jgi:excisionase family DNA binding protein
MALQVIGLTEAAKRLGVHRRTLEREIEQGTGPAVIQVSPRRCGIVETTLDAWIKGCEMRLSPHRIRKPNVVRGNPSTMNEANAGSGASPPFGGVS